MNIKKAKHGRYLATLIFCGILMPMALPACHRPSPATAPENNQELPVGPVTGHGVLLARDPALDVLTIRIDGKPTDFWVTKNTLYLKGKNKIQPEDLKINSEVQFSGWSYGHDIILKSVQID